MTLNQTTNHHTKRILWAFGLECALFIVILLFLDGAPTWFLRISAILAIALPIVCYLTIATQASVYRSWLNMAQELRCALVAGVRCLWHCLTFKNARELAHRIAKMKAFPSTADDWFALMLFPFKAYVLAAFPFLWTCRAVHGLF